MPLPIAAAVGAKALGAVGAAGLAAAGSYFSGKLSARESERMYKHRYQWQVRDMQKRV